MRALKSLVIVMAVLILAGSATLVALIGGWLSRSGPGTAPSPPLAAAPIDVPAGARIENIGVGSDRLVLDLVLSDGNRQLVIIDLHTGRRLDVIPLRPTP